MNIYVANIPFTSSVADLKERFEQFGTVTSAKIVIDKLTNRSRGFGFVEMADNSAGREAINNLNGSDFEGKSLVVNEARPKTDTQTGGYGNGSRGGFNSRW
ncbi:RNA recognition motif domain-containing protein [Dawidia soli]|uniref:RNA-binding protein n=1 Tax=Dawidia soli TaxID=2782352 RepID=A0AAP2DHU5_9BACT|nr:RNA-binding protein [Dawidia soli]MBT1689652.1 RNA-binding protein [Dawidia soli]